MLTVGRRTTIATLDDVSDGAPMVLMHGFPADRKLWSARGSRLASMVLRTVAVIFLTTPASAQQTARTVPHAPLPHTYSAAATAQSTAPSEKVAQLCYPSSATIRSSPGPSSASAPARWRFRR